MFEEEAAAPGDSPEKSDVQREELENMDASRAQAIARWKETIRGDRAHWKSAFERMRKDMEFAKLGADAQWVESGNYVANIIQRHINTRVADLYAKNPRVVAKARPRMEFTAWDGSLESLQMAQAAFTINPADPGPQAIIQDAMAGAQRKKLLQGVSRTTELLATYFQDEQEPSYKRSIKRGVRRSLVTGVAYCELGFQRILENRPEITQQIRDASDQLARIESLSADLQDGRLEEGNPDREELQVLIGSLQEQEQITVREGPTYDWNIGSTEIIPDRNTRQLNGFVGAGHIAREMPLTAKQIQETYKVDIRNGSASRGTSVEDTPSLNTRDGTDSTTATADDQTTHLVWKVWDRRTGTEFVITDSWNDYLVAPKTPDVQVDRFWPVYVLELNPVEDIDTPAKASEGKQKRRIHGLSDVELIRGMQEEYNRQRQGLRDHKIANRPATIAVRGLFTDADKAQFEGHAANDLIEVDLSDPNMDIAKRLMNKPVNPIDPNLYDVSQVFDDIQRTSGTQEANLGGLTGATATEASIAEGGRVGSSQSNIDDLDELLTELARGTGQVLFHNMSKEQVVKIVGPGAVWPEFTAQEIAEEVYLTIKAGSSGRPNRALEIANLERMAPFLVQIPGIPPKWLAQKMIERVDEDFTLEDAYVEGLPSILAMNAMAGPAGGAVGGQPASAGTGPQSDPAQQGGQGGNNAPQPETGGQATQAAFPAPFSA